MRGKGGPVAQAVEFAEERQPVRRVAIGEPGQKDPSEQAGDHPHWHVQRPLIGLSRDSAP
jgi:hypothetical protein